MKHFIDSECTCRHSRTHIHTPTHTCTLKQTHTPPHTHIHASAHTHTHTHQLVREVERSDAARGRVHQGRLHQAKKLVQYRGRTNHDMSDCNEYRQCTSAWIWLQNICHNIWRETHHNQGRRAQNVRGDNTFPLAFSNLVMIRRKNMMLHSLV